MNKLIFVLAFFLTSCFQSYETKQVIRCAPYADKKEMVSRLNSDAMMMYVMQGWRAPRFSKDLFYRQGNQVCVRRLFARPKSLLF